MEKTDISIRNTDTACDKNNVLIRTHVSTAIKAPHQYKDRLSRYRILIIR